MPRSIDRGRELERYLALTLCLDDALKNERWEEATILMSERDEALSRFETAKIVLTDAETEKIRTAEKRIMAWLQHTRALIGESIRTNVTRGAMSRLYARSGGPSAASFNRAS